MQLIAKGRIIMKASASQVSRDSYLLKKFMLLQQAARFAKGEIDAIPATATVKEEFEAVEFAIAGVARRCERLMMSQAETAAGAIAINRAEAWLAGGELDRLFEPLEIAA
jgi:hypothetical protein